MAEPQIPDQFEEAQTTPVVIKDDPVLGPTLGTGKPEGPIPEEAEKDVKTQTEGVDFKDILSGDVTSIGGLNITPKALEAAKKNPGLMKRIKSEHAKAGGATAEDQPVIPFMRDGEFTPTPALIDDPFAMNKAERLAQGRQDVDDILTQSGIDNSIVRQIMIDKYRTGEFFDNLNNRLAEAGQFVGTAIPSATILGIHAFGAWQDSVRKGTDWSSEWAARQRDIQGAFDHTYKMIDQYIPNPTMKMAFNSFVQDELRTRLENGDITQEQFDDTFYVRDADGNLTDVEREFFTDESARSLLDLSFEKLPTSEKYGVIFVETFLGMAGPGKAQGSYAMAKLARLQKKYQGTDVGKAIAGKTDAFEVLNIMENMGVKTGINRRALAIGVGQQRTDAAVDALSDQIAEAGLKLDALRIQGVRRGSTQYKLAKAEYDTLTARMLRAKYTGRVVPYVREAGVDAAVIAAGQLYARETLPTMFDVSPETAEVIGVVTMIAGGGWATKKVGGSLINATTSPRGGVGRVTAQTFDFLGNVATLGALRLGGVRLADNTIVDYEKAIGRKLSPDEIRGIKATIKMVNNLGDAERENVLNAIDEYADLRQRIVGAFPEQDQAEAAELFSLAFSNASGLNFLGAVARVDSNRLDVRDLKGMQLNAVVRNMEASQRQVEITESALANLERLLGRSAIKDKEAVRDLMTSMQNGLVSAKQSNAELMEQQLNILADVRKHVLADPTIDIPEGFLMELVEADTSLNRMLGNIVDERTSIASTMSDIYTGLSVRIQTMRGRRKEGRAYYRELGRTLEDVMDTHLDGLWSRGQAAYDDVRRLAKDRPNVDMGSVVEEMMNKAGDTAYHRFFSAEGMFFAGRLGRQNRMVFNDMARRALGDVDRIRESLIAGGISQELVDSLDDFGIAMEFKRINPSFEPFSELNAYEVDVLRRSFADYAFRVRDKNPGLKQEYLNYADVMDDAIRQDTEMYNALLAARKIYRSEVGDRLRTGLLYKLDKSRKGGKIVTFTGDDMFAYAYGNVNPMNLFDGVSNNMTKALRGNTSAQGDILADIGGIVTAFGDTVDGKRMFDLTTDQGRAKFEALQQAMSEKVYADWADRAIKVAERVRGPSAIRTGGYDFGAGELADADVINSLSMVPVRLSDGTMTEVPLFDLRNIFDDAKSLDAVVAASDDVKKKYTTLVENYNNLDGKFRRNIANNIKKRDDDFAELSTLLGGYNPSGFYQRYIIDGSLGELDDMRDMFVAAQVKAGRTAEDAAEIFDAGVGRLVAKGFKERGGLAPVDTAVLSASKRDIPVAREFKTPENMLLDIREHGDKLEAVLGEEHVTYLTDIASFLVRSKSQSVRLDGMTSGYSLNEGLSRLYNISRGMVSPLYVTSEFMVRAASRSNIDLLEMAAQNKDAAMIISRMFKTPELITRQDVEMLDAALSEFVLTEMARNDMYMPELNEMFLLPEEETNEENE